MCPPAEAATIPPGVGVVINMTISDQSLLAGGDDPAVLSGNIPLPAPLARGILARMPADAAVWIRRLYARPDTGELVAMDSRRRTFTPAMRRLLFARDADTCRTPWCNAPARHADHITPAADGGPTTISNGQALSEDCNYTRSAPGWTGHRDDAGHITVITPTGHRYPSPATRQHPARQLPARHHPARHVDIRSPIEARLHRLLSRTG